MPFQRGRHPFQFTHPGKGATYVGYHLELTFLVSIHAPWEGCDADQSRLQLANITFQFTHPGKGATLNDYILWDAL